MNNNNLSAPNFVILQTQGFEPLQKREKSKKSNFCVVTFGTRNWTVRDIPPSHEAISIMKPEDKTDKL